MSVVAGPKIADASNLVHLVDAANPLLTSGTGTIIDAISNISWSRISVTDNIVDGISCFDLTAGYLQSSSSPTFGQYYTCFYLWKPLIGNTSWKTLHRNNNDHIALIYEADDVSLGFYGNRNGGWRDSGYDITTGIWQSLILTGEGISADTSTGTTTFYVNGENIGSSDRVGCGTNLYRIGWPGQPPGHISIAGLYNVKLSTEEIQSLSSTLLERL